MDKPSLHTIKGGLITTEQLLAYHKGELSEAECRRIEQLMADDPFLADAIEGLQYATPEQVQKALDVIYAKVDARIAAGAKTGFGSQLRKYAAAATILVFLGATLIIMRELNKKTSESEIAFVESAQQHPAFNNADTIGMGAGDSNVEASTIEINRKSNVQPVVTENEFTASEATEDLSGDDKFSIDESINVSEGFSTVGNLDVVKPAVADAYFRTNVAVLSAIPEMSNGDFLLETKSIQEVAVLSDKKQVFKRKDEDKPNKENELTKDYSGAPAGASDTETMDDFQQGDSVMMADVQPQFVGGEKALVDYFNANLGLPLSVSEGVVYVRFVVQKNGTIANAYVVQGINLLPNENVLKAVNNMPAWIPGKVQNVPVDTWISLPITIGKKTDY